MPRERKCKQCGVKKPADEGVQTPVSWFCSTDCAYQYQLEQRRKQQDKVIAKARRLQAEKEKDERKRHRERKEALKTMPELKSEAQRWFNKWIRLSDPFDSCCSCDRTADEIEVNDGWKIGGCWDAGHFHSRAARPDLRFNEDNCWRQCKSCNAGSGKYGAKQKTVSIKYREKLIERIGIERVEALDYDPGPKKWTREELIAIAEKYKNKCKEYK
jgi:hypothetical protein